MGCRVLQVSPFFVEQWLREGTDAFDPVDAPKDIEVLSARMNFSGQPIIELLVKSEKWDGADTDTFETAKPWNVVFRRRAAAAAAGGRDAGKRS